MNGSLKILCLFLLVTGSVRGQDTDSSQIGLHTLFYNLDVHLGRSFTYNYGLNHILAAGGTYGLVKSGADWRFHELARRNKALAYAGFPSVILGGIIPVLVPLGLYIYGDNPEIRRTAMALGQAALISWMVSSGYKALTGRRGPDILEDNTLDVDYSQDFKFGLFNRGTFDGWPSGHTTSAVAMATTLIILYPANDEIKYGAIAYASLIGIGISFNIHWFSDVFAGALIGYSIGNAVGNGFKNGDREKSDLKELNYYLTPYGIGLSYSF